MKYGILGMVILAGIAGSASANQLQSSQPINTGTSGGTAGDALEYKWDSGVSNNSVGIGATADIVWMNQFTVTGGNSSITGINTCFGTPSFAGSSGVTAGSSFRVYVWSGTPAGAHTLLGTATGTVSAGSIDSDVLQTVTFGSAINVGPNGTPFFIGASVVATGAAYPAPLDGSTFAAGRSWIGGSTTAFDPNNIAGGDIGLFDTTAIGLPGTYMVSANAVPAPASMGLLALGGLVAARRRR